MIKGFEVVIHGRKFFAFSKYVHYLGFCNQTMSGWSHDIMGRDWSCYYGEKDGSKNALPRHQYSENLLVLACLVLDYTYAVIINLLSIFYSFKM